VAALTYLKENKFDNEHDYLLKLNEFQTTLYPSLKRHMEVATKRRIDRLNENRTDPPDLPVGTSIFCKENRRNKITPRFSKHTV